MRYARLFSEAGLGLRGSLQPQLPLELAFIEAATGRASAAHEPAADPRPARPATTAPTRSAAPPTHMPVTTPAKPPGASTQSTTLGKPAQTPAQTTPAPAAVKMAVPASPAQPAAQDAPPPAEASALLEEVRRHWPDILRQVRPVNKDAEAFLRSAQPATVEAGAVVLSFKGQFQRDQFEKRSCGPIVAEIVSKVVGQPLTVRCQMDGKAPAAATTQAATRPANSPRPAPQPKPAAAPAADDPVVQAAKQMGGRVRRVAPAAGDEPPPPEAPPWADEE